MTQKQLVRYKSGLWLQSQRAFAKVVDQHIKKKMKNPYNRVAYTGPVWHPYVKKFPPTSLKCYHDIVWALEAKNWIIFIVSSLLLQFCWRHTFVCKWDQSQNWEFLMWHLSFSICCSKLSIFCQIKFKNYNKTNWMLFLISRDQEVEAEVEVEGSCKTCVNVCKNMCKRV